MLLLAGLAPHPPHQLRNRASGPLTTASLTSPFDSSALAPSTGQALAVAAGRQAGSKERVKNATENSISRAGLCQRQQKGAAMQRHKRQHTTAGRE